MTTTIGRSIRTLREALNMSLRELARQSQLSPSFLSGLERGTRTALPGDASIHRLANALGADADDLTLRCGRLPVDVERWLVEDPARVRAVREQMGRGGVQSIRFGPLRVTREGVDHGR